MTLHKRLIFFVLIYLCGLILSGCTPANEANIPQDFAFLLDATSADDFGQHINIRIDAQGKGYYERYETVGAHGYGTDIMITYAATQIVETGKFKLSTTDLENLWALLEEQHFFELTDDYRMAMGSSFAFIVVEANGYKHKVDNIGMEVAEIKAIVEATSNLLPSGVDLVYREGFLP